MNAFERELLKAKPIRVYRSAAYEVRYLNEAYMNGFFGYALDNLVFVRNSLPKTVERFVISHEKYHLSDKHNWLGWVGSETRANIVCGLKDPIGLVTTIFASLNRKRLLKYWNLLTQ